MVSIHGAPLTQGLLAHSSISEIKRNCRLEYIGKYVTIKACVHLSSKVDVWILSHT